MIRSIDDRAAQPDARGFTLLEVVIAVLVLALALLALTRTAALQTADFSQLRERTFAGWLARELLAETRLGSAFAPPGTSSGTRRFGPTDWRFEIRVAATDVATIHRIEVRVYSGDAASTPLAQLTGFSGQDLLP